MFKLSISGLGVTPDQTAVVMHSLGLTGDVEHRTAVTAGRIEPAARVILYDGHVADVFALFKALQTTFGLTCAWLEDLAAGYSGCILEYPDVDPPRGKATTTGTPARFQR